MGTAEKNLRKARKQRRLVGAAFHALEDGQITLQEILQDPPPSLENVDIWDILRRSPKLGRKGAERVLMKAKVWPHRRLRSLNRGERLEIMKHLPPRVH